MATATFPMIGQITANMPNLHIVAGQVLTDATTPTRKRGKGFTVSKPGTGRYLVTLNRKAGWIISAHGMIRKAAGSATVLTGPVFVDEQNVEFRSENASGAATDLGNTENIVFTIICSMSKLSVV